MHFLLSVLVVIASVILVCCSSLTMDNNHQVSRQPQWKSILDKDSNYSSPGESIRRRKCTRDRISVRREWLVFDRYLLSLNLI